MTRRGSVVLVVMVVFGVLVRVFGVPAAAALSTSTPPPDVLTILWQDFCDRHPEHAKCAVPAPTPTPVPPATTCNRTFTGDSSGATDVTAALNTFLNGGSNATSCLTAAGTYRVTGQLHIDGNGGTRSAITVDGQGATIFQAVRATTPIILVDHGSTGVLFRNVTIKGSNPQPGIWSLTYEHNHGIQFGGMLSGGADHVTIKNVGGDGFYLAGSFVGAGFRFEDNVSVRNSVVDGTGRMGVAFTDGANHMTVDHTTFTNIAYYTFDFEANGHIFNGVAAGTIGATLSNNTIGPIPFGRNPTIAGQATGYAFVITGSSGGGPAEGITFTGNTMTDPTWGELRVGIFNNGGTRKNIAITNNRGVHRFAASSTYGSTLMKISGVAGLTVTGNVQPISAGTTLVTCSGCSGTVTLSPNTTT